MYGGHLPCETSNQLVGSPEDSLSETSGKLVQASWRAFFGGRMSISMESSELVSDPVGHISISGVHGRDELEERLAHPPSRRNGQDANARSLLIGAAIGAAVVYLLKR